jgi:hypothetical protein
VAAGAALIECTKRSTGSLRLTSSGAVAIGCQAVPLMAASLRMREYHTGGINAGWYPGTCGIGLIGRMCRFEAAASHRFDFMLHKNYEQVS